MAFEETIFPEKISIGSSGGPGHNTVVVRTDSGHEERISRWSIPLRRYNIRWDNRDMDDHTELLKFYIGLGGAAIGFRFKDFDDFSTDATGRGTPAATDVEIGTGDGSKVEFQLFKEYEQGTVTKTRNLQKIISSSVTVEVDGVPQTETTHYTVNYNTGIITFNTAPAGGLLVTAGCQFHVPVRFSEETDDLLELVREGHDMGSLQNVALVEIRDGLELPGVEYQGGAQNISTSIDMLLTPQDGKALKILVGAAAVTIRLLSAALLPSGGTFHIIEADATGVHNWNLEDQGGAGIVTMTPGDVKELYIGIDGAGANIWKAL